MALLISGRRLYTVEDVRWAQRILAQAYQALDTLPCPRLSADKDIWADYSVRRDMALRQVMDAEETLQWVEARWRWGFPGGDTPSIPGVGAAATLPELEEQPSV